MRAGKGGTLSEHLIHLSKEASKRSQLLAKHAYRHWYFQKLLLFLMFFKKLCIYKHELSHRDDLARINFTSNKIWIKNRTSFICPYYLKHSLFSYGRKLLLWSYLSHNFHKHEVHWNHGKSLKRINWLASGTTGFFPFNQTNTETRPSEIGLITRNKDLGIRNKALRQIPCRYNSLPGIRKSENNWKRK